MILAPGVDASVLASVLPGPSSGTNRVAEGPPGAPRCVREGPYRYENEGSEHRTHGSVTVSAAAWWSVVLSVPADEAGARDGTVVVQCQRHGEAAAGYRGDGLVELVLPRAEIGAVVTLLAGAAEQARRDGLLPRDG